MFYYIFYMTYMTVKDSGNTTKQINHIWNWIHSYFNSDTACSEYGQYKMMQKP